MGLLLTQTVSLDNLSQFSQANTGIVWWLPHSHAFYFLYLKQLKNTYHFSKYVVLVLILLWSHIETFFLKMLTVCVCVYVCTHTFHINECWLFIIQQFSPVIKNELFIHSLFMQHFQEHIYCMTIEITLLKIDNCLLPNLNQLTIHDHLPETLDTV